MMLCRPDIHLLFTASEETLNEESQWYNTCLRVSQCTSIFPCISPCISSLCYAKGESVLLYRDPSEVSGISCIPMVNRLLCASSTESYDSMTLYQGLLATTGTHQPGLGWQKNPSMHKFRLFQMHPGGDKSSSFKPKHTWE